MNLESPPGADAGVNRRVHAATVNILEPEGVSEGWNPSNASDFQVADRNVRTIPDTALAKACPSALVAIAGDCARGMQR
jgi:hypothetical protein